MANEVIATATIIKLMLPMIGTIGAACFLLGKLAPRVTGLKRHEHEWYATAVGRFGAIEKQLATLQGLIIGFRDEVADLRSLLL